VVSYLELMKQAYTGCNPRGLLLTHDKALSKKILSHHRIKVPRFKVFTRGRAAAAPKRLRFPLFVKSLTEEGSYGLAQASVVKDEAKLIERVQYLHQKLETDVIAEEFIRGREIYVAVFGHKRLEILPFIELQWGKVSGSDEVIATSKAKWDLEYQKRHKIEWREAGNLSPAMIKKIESTGKQVYRSLGLTGYARIDLRVSDSGDVYVLEANPNPDLAREGELHQAAKAAGHDYHWLLTRVLQLAQSYEPEWKGSPL
jgi:D-alanine-D-alanine ligase